MLILVETTALEVDFGRNWRPNFAPFDRL